MRNKPAILLTHGVMKALARAIAYDNPITLKGKCKRLEQLKDFWWLARKWHRNFFDNCPKGYVEVLSVKSNGRHSSMFYLTYEEEK
jgi:hypothetical protein